MKVTVISDTHTKHRLLDLPPADMIIHCGDFSHSTREVPPFVKWFGNLDYKYKILIAGNHDKFVEHLGYKDFFEYCESKGIIYLQDTGVTIEGIKFWGSPMCNQFYDWAFMAEEPELYENHWKKIPSDTNVLITHGPAYGKCDKVFQDNIDDNHVGSKTLEMKTKELKNLKYHFVGHIHDSCGEIYQDEHFITYNACIMDFSFKPTGEPHTFEID